MIADPFSRMVVINAGSGDFGVALNTKSLVFGADLGSRLEGSHVAAVTAVFTWSMTDFPSAVGAPSRCLTKTLTVIPAAEVEPLVLFADLPLSALPALSLPVLAADPELPPQSTASVEVGNVHTLLTQGYSAKEQGKLRALLHLREFYTTGNSSENKWVRWLSKKLTFDGSDIWKVDKTLKLKVLETPGALLQVLKELHDGFGHRALPAVYHHFKLRYWVPAAAKVIKHYIEGCSSC